MTEPLAYLQGTLFYLPWPEREWQEPSHFRKSFCLRHSNMEIVVGGHFFRREANPSFFGALTGCPHNMPESDGAIFHFEMRDYADALLHKWRDLSKRHLVSGIDHSGPWGEKEEWMGQLWVRYNDRQLNLYDDFARKRNTLWGTKIPPERLRCRDVLSGALLHIPSVKTTAIVRS